MSEWPGQASNPGPAGSKALPSIRCLSQVKTHTKSSASSFTNCLANYVCLNFPHSMFKHKNISYPNTHLHVLKKYVFKARNVEVLLGHVFLASAGNSVSGLRFPPLPVWAVCLSLPSARSHICGSTLLAHRPLLVPALARRKDKDMELCPLIKSV